MSAVLASRRLVEESFLDDPYPTYRALREAGPIHWSHEFFGGAWLLTRHDDVEMVLRDTRFSAQRTGGWVTGTGEGAREELKGFQRLFARAMLFLDAPDHQRIRRVLNAGSGPMQCSGWCRTSVLPPTSSCMGKRCGEEISSSG